MLLDALHNYRLRAFPDLGSPVMATPTIWGNTGSTTYEYVATVTTINGETMPSDPVAIENGPDTLSSSNYVVLSLETVPAGVVTIKFFKKSETQYLFCTSCAASENSAHDIGQGLTSVTPPDVDTSGRNTWQFIGFKTGRVCQRMELMDLQAIQHKHLRDLGDTIYKNGDVIQGSAYSAAGGGSVTGTLAGPFNVDGKKLSIGFQTEAVYTITLSGTSASASEVAATIEDAVNAEVDLIECEELPGGYLKLQASGGRAIVLYTCENSAYSVLGLTTGTYQPLTWNFAEGKIYFEGLIIEIPAGQVSLTGQGEEKAGVQLQATVVDYSSDEKLLNLDDEVIPESYAVPGADRIIVTPEWCVDQDGMVVIQKFTNGMPNKINIPTVYSEIDQKLARRTFDVSGSFVVNNFRLTIDNHPSDSSKLLLQVGPGTAYPNGYEVAINTTKVYDLDKGRDTQSVENSSLDTYSEPGGYIIGTATENFNVDGKALKIKIGSGNSHTVELSGDGQTATQVASQIQSSVNAYPSSGSLVSCSGADGHVKIEAVDGKTLILEAVSDDAYSILGLETGTYYTIGTRIYRTNDGFIKSVSDLSYIVEIVEAVTHNGSSHKDLLSKSNVATIVGASDPVTDAHDGKWDYVNGVDFQKDGNYISFVGMSGGEPANGATYYVKYRYRHNPARGTRTLVRVIDAPITKGTPGGFDFLSFAEAASVKRVRDNTTINAVGSVKDVTRILQVNPGAGYGSTYYTNCILNKNSDALAHNPSSIDWSSAGAEGSGPTGQPYQGTTYYVSFECWYHEVGGDYVSADSYDVYEEIEKAPNGYWELRDCVDFRTLGVKPLPGDAPVLDYDYYLPRKDKIMLNQEGQFIIHRGEPSSLAPAPKDIPGFLALALLFIPPYTYSKEDVAVVSTEPVRMTQEGIRNLEKRIERLEYWNAVNNLEREAYTKTITYDSKGLFTDALTGWAKQDLSFDKNGITNNVALDRFERALLLPPDPAHDKDIVLEIDLDKSDGVVVVDDNVVLDYDPEVFDSQLMASCWMKCAPDYALENYYGTLKVFPTTILFNDKEQLPQINADFDNNLTSLLQNIIDIGQISMVNWGEWELATDDNLVTAHQTRTGARYSLVPDRKTLDLGDRVVDISMLSMAATKNPDGSPIVVQLEAHDILPNQDHACLIAGKPVDLILDTDPQGGTAFGSAGTNTYKGCNTVKSSNEGKLTAKFTMPEGVVAGEIPIFLFYYKDATISSAACSLYSSGFLQKNQKTVIGFETPSLKSQELHEEQYMAIRQPNLDPIAESFWIQDKDKYISAVGLYFKSKHSSLGITAELRNMVNGKPGNKLFAWKNLKASEVNVSELGTVETIFTFPQVLSYKLDESFCFVVRPEQNNTDYEIFVAEKNQIDLLTDTRIVQPHLGVLFHSPNLESWQEMTNRDLKFNLYKSNFVDHAAIQWKEITGIQASRFVTKVEEFLSGDTRVSWFYSLDSELTWVAYNPRINVDLQAITSKIILRADITTLGGSYQIVGNTGIRVRLHNESANYITTAQTFSDPLTLPNMITAFADVDAASVNGSGETNITPYYSLDDGETWTELPLKAGYTPVVTTDPYYRYEWELPEAIDYFSSFRGRFEFTTTNKSKTPRIANGLSFICSRI